MQGLLQALANLALRRLGAPVTLQMRSVTELSAVEIAELHALANRLMTEDLAQFTIHVTANDVVHVFRGADGTVLGFQFWRHSVADGMQFIMGGKLRMHPSIRRRALHLYSGLLYYLERRLRKPFTPIVRLSIAALFGFVSITEALAHYELYPARDAEPDHARINAAFARMADFSHFIIRPDHTFFVNIYPSPETLNAYPEAYFERPAARAYRAVNPEFRTSGCYVGFWFRFDAANLQSLWQAIQRRR